MACALSQLKKEVTVISSKAGLLPDIFDEETGLLLKQILEGKGVRVFSENAVEEILGDAEVKAVKFKSGKVLACDTVIFDEAKVDIRMLSEPTLTDQDQICIEAMFQAALCCPLGRFISALMSSMVFMPDGPNCLKAVGNILKFDGPQNIYKKIYAHGDHLAGCRDL